MDAEDNKAWCSILVDSDGDHVSGGGHYGDCGPKCPLPSTLSNFIPKILGYHLLFYFEVNTYLCNHTKVELLELM